MWEESPLPEPGHHRVTIQPSGVSVMVRKGESVVDALRRAGYRTRYKCRRGGCGVCRATLLSGSVSYLSPVSEEVVRGEASSQAFDDDGRPCLPCRASPDSDTEIRLGPNDHLVHVFRGLVLEAPDAGAEPNTTVTAKPTPEGNEKCQF